MDALAPAGGFSLNIPRLVRPVRFRLAVARALRLTLACLAAGLLAAAAMTLAGHLVAWPAGDPLGGYAGWRLLALALALVAAPLLVLRALPKSSEAMRLADGALSLKDRLTTAHEFAGRDDHIVRLQRAELEAMLPGLDLRRAARIAVPYRHLAITAVAALLLAGATFLPDRQATAARGAQQQAAVLSHARTRAAVAVARLHSATQTQPDRRNPATQQAAAILRKLQAQLAKATSPAQALKAVTEAQQQLQKLGAAGAQAAQSLRALSHALAGGQTQALSRALASGNPTQTRQALANLQHRVAGMTAAQRAALAGALNRAANAVPGTLGDTLRQAAFHLADNNVPAAQQALRAAGRQITAAQQAASAGQLSHQALQDVQNIRRDVATGATGNSTRAGTAAATRRTGAKPGAQRQGQSGANGKQSGAGNATTQTRQGAAGGRAGQNGQPGQGRNAGTTGTNGGQGQVAGQTTGQGQGGRGGGSAHGAGGTRGSAGGNGAGRLQSVYLPGPLNGGPSVTTQGPLGQAVPVQSPAFRQLLPQYSNAAQSSLGRTTLPPALQDTVRRYFQGLEK